MFFSIADNLPVATRLEFYPNREAGGEEEQKKDVVKDIQFEHGYRLGFVDSNKVDIIKCLCPHTFIRGGERRTEGQVDFSYRILFCTLCLY